MIDCFISLPLLKIWGSHGKVTACYWENRGFCLGLLVLLIKEFMNRPKEIGRIILFADKRKAQSNKLHLFAASLKRKVEKGKSHAICDKLPWNSVTWWTSSHMVGRGTLEKKVVKVPEKALLGSSQCLKKKDKREEKGKTFFWIKTQQSRQTPNPTETHRSSVLIHLGREFWQ